MHHHHGGSCDCANEGKEPGDLVSLYSSVDIDRVCALNEVQSGSGKLVIKPYEQRLDEVTTIRSICDGELLFIVPFVVSVGLKAITVRGIAGACPTNLKIWANRQDIDFNNASYDKPTQELYVPHDPSGTLKLFLHQQHFTAISSLTLLLSQPQQADSEIEINYIGFFGKPHAVRRQVVDVVYESQANPMDHPVKESFTPNNLTVQ
uniref:PITH domain-containing protein 1 n=1 Tax=Lygus hesperus TaxID=30085 RepID=A0A0A9W5A1_LYGHE